MITVKGYGISNSEKHAKEMILQDIDKALKEAITVGFGLCEDKDIVVDSFNKALEEQEKETGNKVEGLFPVEIEISFSPKVKVKKVEYAENKTDDN